jgi:hypothetical protein
MLKIFILFIVGSVVSDVSSYLFNCNCVDITQTLLILMAYMDLNTGVPVDGYSFTNLTELINFITEANYNFELGCIANNGVLYYAIKIGGVFYSVEPNIFHELIYILF